MEASRHNERPALTYALLAVLLWSTVATGFKLGLTVLAVEQLLLFGTLISWCVFALYCSVRSGFFVYRQDRLWLPVLGFLNPFAYYLLLFAAYDRLPAHVAQPLNYTWAITLALLAVPVLKQKLTGQTLIGIAVSYSGVVLLLSGASETSPAPLNSLGIVLALLSTVLWAAYWLINTRCASDAGAMMFWSFSCGLPLVVLACAAGPGWPEWTLTNLAYGSWVGIVEMGVTFLLWQQALRHTRNVARIGQLIFLSPFLSLLLINQVLGEVISWQAVAGLAVIIAGLVLTQRAQAV
jgi:drug/metabolite transporter (DMT)-like permease